MAHNASKTQDMRPFTFTEFGRSCYGSVVFSGSPDPPRMRDLWTHPEQARSIYDRSSPICYHPGLKCNSVAENLFLAATVLA